MVFAHIYRHNMYHLLAARSSLLFLSLLLVGCWSGSSGSAAPAPTTTTGRPGAEASVGERLFVETRFAQSFKAYLDSGGR